MVWEEERVNTYFTEIPCDEGFIFGRDVKATTWNDAKWIAFLRMEGEEVVGVKVGEVVDGEWKDYS